MHASRRFVQCLCAAAVSVGAGGRSSAQPGDPSDAHMVCGARVVEFVLTWYDRPAEADDLVRELQGTRPDRPVSVAAVAAALENRGLHARVVRAPTPGVVDWHGPVVYHTVNADGVGHFFVRAPARGRFPALYWCDTLGFSTELPAEYAAGLSGVMVLASEAGAGDDELPATQAEPGLPTGWRSWCIAAAAAGAVGVAGLLFRRGRAARGVSI